MGLKDNVTKEYMKDNRRFADVFNSFVYEGDQVIKPESLQEQDTTELLNFYGISDELISKQEFRDVLKKCVLMRDEKAHYLLFGIENQSNIHYAMPVKNCIYDALNYGAQADEAAKKHRKLKDTKGAEFLSGFSKTDKLTPVITLVILWNSGVWDGPRSLHEMMCVQEPRILRFVPDYKLNLVVPGEINDFGKFKTELQETLELISVQDDKIKMETLLSDKPDVYSNIDIDSAKVLETCMKISFPNRNSKGGVDVCKAINDMIESKEKENAISFYKNGVSIEIIAKSLSLPIEKIRSWILSAGLQIL